MENKNTRGKNLRRHDDSIMFITDQIPNSKIHLVVFISKKPNEIYLRWTENCYVFYDIGNNITILDKEEELLLKKINGNELDTRNYIGKVKDFFIAYTTFPYGLGIQILYSTDKKSWFPIGNTIKKWANYKCNNCGKLFETENKKKECEEMHFNTEEFEKEAKELKDFKVLEALLDDMLEKQDDFLSFSTFFEKEYGYFPKEIIKKLEKKIQNDCERDMKTLDELIDIIDKKDQLINEDSSMNDDLKMKNDSSMNDDLSKTDAQSINDDIKKYLDELDMLIKVIEKSDQLTKKIQENKSKKNEQEMSSDNLFDIFMKTMHSM